MTELQLNNGRKQKRWVAPVSITPEADEQLKEYPPSFRQVLFNRSLDTAEKAHKFLHGSLNEYDPFLMMGMREAVEIILKAIKNHKSIIIYGDYDVDGVTSTALLIHAVGLLGGKVSEYIPNRFDEGYGLNIDALHELKEKNVDLVVTVDCGIRSVKEAELARELGIQLIITDHHHPLETVPQADVVICPKQERDSYPYKELVGVGIAYKLARALFTQSVGNPSVAEQWLDLVALGTVSDIAPLTDENRLLVKKGLQILRTRPRQGIYSLMVVADIRNRENLTASDIGFKLGPRLNAAGRMKSAMNALNLLLTEIPQEAGKLAQELQEQNVSRQKFTVSDQKFAESQLTDIERTPIIIAFGDEDQLHSGIVGLVAARLVETHYRPAIVGVIGKEFTKASCRSIDEFHITNALDECKDLLVRHGGHSKAAGFTIENAKLEELKTKLTLIADKQLAEFGIENLLPTVKYDAEITFSELKEADLYNLQTLLEPTGNENPQPIFKAKGLHVKNFSKIGNDIHLRMTLEQNDVVFPAVAFQMGYWADHMPNFIDIVFYLDIDRYSMERFGGKPTLQLKLIDIHQADM